MLGKTLNKYLRTKEDPNGTVAELISPEIYQNQAVNGSVYWPMYQKPAQQKYYSSPLPEKKPENVNVFKNMLPNEPFAFGKGRVDLANYVREQLFSPERKQNQKRLEQFRQRAVIFRNNRRYLHASQPYVSSSMQISLPIANHSQLKSEMFVPYQHRPIQPIRREVSNPEFLLSRTKFKFDSKRQSIKGWSKIRPTQPSNRAKKNYLQTHEYLQAQVSKEKKKKTLINPESLRQIKQIAKQKRIAAKRSSYANHNQESDSFQPELPQTRKGLLHRTKQLSSRLQKIKKSVHELQERMECGQFDTL